MSTYVLVHGAWHGGWAWRDAAASLRARGHVVFAPTCTGLGERAHLLGPSVGLDTFIDDVAAVIECEELRDVVLVGHSFGGVVISGVADRIPQALSQLVYLDALIVPGGQSALGMLPAAVQQERRRTIGDDGVRMVPPGTDAMGVFEPAQVAWVRRRVTPHPLKTYLDVLQLAHPIGNGLPKTYVAVTNPWYAPLAGVRESVRAEMGADANSWRWREIAAGHDAMVTNPVELAELLHELGARNSG